MDAINTNSQNWSSSAFSDVTCSCLERGEICWNVFPKTCQNVPEECSEHSKAWQIVPDKCSRRLKWFHRLERLVHLAGCLVLIHQCVIVFYTKLYHQLIHRCVIVFTPSFTISLFTGVWLFLHHALPSTYPADFKRLPACQRSSIAHIFMVFAMVCNTYWNSLVCPTSKSTCYQNLMANDLLGCCVWMFLRVSENHES